MFCPNCGQERISEETRFCSRCGFLLVGTAELMLTGGVIPQSLPGGTTDKVSPRTRGLKQGLFIFLLSFLVVPIIAIITVALHLPPWGIPISAITLFVGGLLRMAYAGMFEPHTPAVETASSSTLSGSRNYYSRGAAGAALPPQTSISPDQYGYQRPGEWRDTNDLQPTSVTDGTTKLLERDQP